MSTRSLLWVRVVSDVHLEFRTNLTNERKWDALVPKGFLEEPEYRPEWDRSCLVLAGDIGYPSSSTYEEYVTRCKSRFDHVVVVAGNHESYQQKVRVEPERCLQEPDYLPDPNVHATHKGRVRIKWTDQWARGVCEKVGAIFLQKDVHEIVFPDSGRIKIAGCTLWSRIPNDKALEASYSLNDFSHALDDHGAPFDVKAYNSRHEDHVRWMVSQLESDDPPDIAVVHHLPSSRLIDPKFARSSINCCFASDSISERLLRRAKLWCAGHSHAFVQTRFEGELSNHRTVAIVNPIGYPKEKTGFDPQWFYVLESR